MTEEWKMSTGALSVDTCEVRAEYEIMLISPISCRNLTYKDDKSYTETLNWISKFRQAAAKLKFPIFYGSEGYSFMELQHNIKIMATVTLDCGKIIQ